MKDKVSVLLVGIGGFGENYARLLLESGEKEGVFIAGAVDVMPEKSRYFEALKQKGVAFYSSMEEFYAGKSADLAIITTPIQYHCPLTCLALERGSNVLCEKPLSATAQEAYEMIKARDRAGKFTAIGYQWSFSGSIQELKKDAAGGLFGRPVRFKAITLWPRDFAYYARSSWAGKIKNDSGQWILDSVASNATAHHLHNMLYVAGVETGRSALPKTVTAELYRANRIESFDTSVIRVVTQGGLEILQYASHAVKNSYNVTFCLEFENAVVTYGGLNGERQPVKAVFGDGNVKIYGDPENETFKKLWTCIDAVRSGSSIPCGIEAALSHTICINGAHESMRKIAGFPGEAVRLDSAADRVWVEGLEEIMTACFNKGTTPWEERVPWASEGKEVNVQAYTCFKG